MAIRYQGRITNWRDDKGFGFITPKDGGAQVFAHISAFANRRQRPQGGELVTYERVSDNKGRPSAKAVLLVGAAGALPASGKRSRFPLVLAAGFLLCVGAAVFTGRLPVLILAFYVSTSIAAFVAYGLDKAAAQGERWRIPENTLHLLALLGGWPGALVAQRLFRHKSAKASFLFAFRITVVVNSLALIGLLTPTGAAMLRSAMGGQ